VSSDPPNLYATLNYRGYLADWFDWKKSVHPRFSHRLFARLAGQKSPSLLKAVVDGRRNLTPTTLPGFAAALQLDGDARAFFEDLVQLDQAEADDDRNAAWARISATRRFRAARRIEGEAFRFFSHWAYVAIYELVKRADFREDPRWIARTLRPRVKASEARQALAELRSLGLLVEGADGRLQQADASVVTPTEVRGLAVHNYHRGMSGLAHDAVSAFRPHERHLLGVTVTIPESALPDLKRELNAMQARLLDLCDSADGPAERVMQINLQLFPLSAPLETP
jgi:uncharacterized protein (TIGR02147 family)